MKNSIAAYDAEPFAPAYEQIQLANAHILTGDNAIVEDAKSSTTSLSNLTANLTDAPVVAPVPPRPAWNRRLIKFGETPPALLSLTVVAPPEFLFVLVQSALTTLTVEISYEMHTTVDQIQWVQHAETIMVCTFSIISNRIHAFFGEQLCYILSAWLVAIGDMLIFFLHKYFPALLALRAISAIGFALNLTATTPMSNQLVRKGQIETCLSYTIVAVPAASLVATFAFPKLATACGWQYIFLLAGSLSLVHALYLSVFCPIKPMDKTVRLDVFACVFVLVAVFSIVLGVGMLEKLNNASICVVLILIGAACIIAFYKRNLKLKQPLIAVECFNRNTVTFLLSFFFTCAGSQADLYFESMIWQQIFGFNAVMTGILTGISKAFCLFFIGFFSWVVKHCCVKYITTACDLLFIFTYIIKIICLSKLRNAIVIEIIYTVNQLIFLQNQLAIMTYNVVGSPPKYGPISSTMVGFFSKFSWSLGIAFCLSVNAVAKQISRGHGIVNPEELQVSGINCAHIAGIVFFLLGILFSSNIGVFLWERGRVGYADHKLREFDTYDVLKVEIDRYLANAKGGSEEIEDIVKYYQGRKNKMRKVYAYSTTVE